MRIEALPISQRSPTVAPMTRHRCPKVLRRPTVVGIMAVPTTTEFSSTAEPAPIVRCEFSEREDGAFGDQGAVAETRSADSDRR